MKVYLVTRYIDLIQGVFSSESKAQSFIEDCEPDPIVQEEDFDIQEYEVDAYEAK